MPAPAPPADWPSFVFPMPTCLPANPSIFVTGDVRVTILGAEHTTHDVDYYTSADVHRIDIDKERGTFELLLDSRARGLQRMLRAGCPFIPYAVIEEIEATAAELSISLDSNASGYRIEWRDGAWSYVQGNELHLAWQAHARRLRVVALFVDGSEKVVLDRSLTDDVWTRLVMSGWTWLGLFVCAVLLAVPWRSRHIQVETRA